MTYYVGDDEQGWWKVSPAERRAGASARHAAKVRKGTAYHESGHAIAAHVLDIPLAPAGISIIPDEDSWGRCYAMLLPPPLPGASAWRQHQARYRAECVYSLCGPPAALLAWGGRPPNHAIHAGGDEENAAETLRLTFGQSEEDRGLDLEYLRVLAAGLIGAEVVRPALEALAGELLAKGELKRRRLLTILRRTLTEDDRLQLQDRLERMIALTDFVRRTFHGTDEGDTTR